MGIAPPALTTSTILKEAGAAAAFLTALYDCTTKRQAVSILYLYFEKRCSANMLTSVADYLSEMLGVNIMDSQAGDVEEKEMRTDPEDVELPDWLKSLKSARHNWTAVTSNGAFAKVSKLLSMSAALGLCDLASLKFDVNGIRIFSVPTYKKHLSAFDLFDACLDTIIYFVEGGYKCFKTGSLKPFIFSDQEAQKFEKRFFEICDLAPFMKTGTMESKKNVTETDFDFKLTKTLEMAENLYHAAEGSFEKQVMYSRMMKLRGIRADFIAIRCDGKLREAPYGFFVHGRPGIGKSTICSVLMRAILMANGFDASDERILTVNESDRFEPTYRGYINGVHFDDWGQTLPKFAQKSPVEKLFEYVNNVAAYANMPEADLKGKIPKTPACIGANGNTVAYKVAANYTSSVEAAVRRFLLHAEGFVKPEFALPDGRLDSKKALDHYGGKLPAIPDLWTFKHEVPDLMCQPTYLRTVNESITLPELVEWAIRDSRRHFANQKEIVTYGANLDKRLEFCSECKYPGSLCKCSTKNPAVDKLLDGAFELDDDEVLDPHSLEDMRNAARRLINEARNLLHPWLRWTNYIPDNMFDNTWVDCILFYLNRNAIWNATFEAYASWRYGMFISMLTALASFQAGFVMFFFSSWAYLRTVVLRKREIITQLRDMNGAMPEIFRYVRDNHVKTIAITGSLMWVIYMLVKSYKATRTLHSQANLDNPTPEDIKQRDAEVSPWAGIIITRPKATWLSNTLGTIFGACNKVKKNLVWFEMETDERIRYTNAFAWKGNYILIPGHIWSDESAIGRIFRHGKGKNVNGNMFESYLHREKAAVEVAPDLYMVQFDNVQIFPDISDLISREIHRDTPAVLLARNEAGEYAESKIMARRGTVRTAAASFEGYNYTVSEGTRNGMCMAPIISDTVNYQIIGFHLGGKGTAGGAIAIDISMLERAEKLLKQKIVALSSPAKGEVLTEQYGVSYYKGEEVSHKSPTRFLPEGNTVEHYGSCAGKLSKNYSMVTKTPISATVTEVTGVPNKWGSPQFHSWKPWQASLQYASKPSIGVEVELLEKAIVDYEAPIVQLLKDREDIRESVRPLTEMETVCGKDGVRFIDAMKSNTSVGFPLSGPKSDYLIDLNPEDYPDFNCPRELDQQFWNTVKEMEEKYLDGVACHPIFKACLKDEPTPLEKEKVRVFQAAPIALQLLVRKYFLPIARVLSLNPFLSECAVGINAQGPEWNQLREFVTKYGEDRILAGDYSKYDLRMPAQLIRAAFKILLNIARASKNYTEDDLKIMEGIAADIANPTMAYNGDLLGLVGSNPSGQNLTVYINSIVNSLLFRCAFYEIVAERKRRNMTFRDVCALITYGDDAKSSVREGFDEFNHLSYAQFLAEHDMKFTMPDKTSTPTAFMHDKDADFLKRRNIWNSRVNMYFGALDEGSIFKSLHSVLHSTAVTPEEVAAMNIDGALREWFAYGEEVYEHRRSQMNEIASREGISHMCSMLDKDYETMLIRFADQYEVPLLDSQCGGIPTDAELDKYTSCVNMVMAMSLKGREDTKTYRQALKRKEKFEAKFGNDHLLDAQAGFIPPHAQRPAYLTEENQLNELRTRMEYYGYHCVCLNKPLLSPTIGEIDGFFETQDEDGTKVYILVEAKILNGRRKAMAQLKKYGTAIHILQPKSHLRTVFMQGRKLEAIEDFGSSKHIFPAELSL
jgi:hypothetical protein